jgi:hypothetical protein
MEREGGGGGSRLGNGEERRGKKRGGSGVGGATQRKEEGGLATGRARGRWRQAPVGDVRAGEGRVAHVGHA